MALDYYNDSMLDLDWKEVLKKVHKGEWTYKDQELWYIMRARERRLGRTPSQREKSRKKELKLLQYDWCIVGMVIILFICTIIMAVMQLYNLALPLTIVLFLIPIISEKLIMKNWIGRITGINIINMKLTAVANYLKVKFVHIPEHYKCEELK